MRLQALGLWWLSCGLPEPLWGSWVSVLWTQARPTPLGSAEASLGPLVRSRDEQWNEYQSLSLYEVWASAVLGTPFSS